MKNIITWQNLKAAWADLKKEIGRQRGKEIRRKAERTGEDKYVQGAVYIAARLLKKPLDKKWQDWLAQAASKDICLKAREGQPPFTPYLAGIAIGILGTTPSAPIPRWSPRLVN